MQCGPGLPSPASSGELGAAFPAAEWNNVIALEVTSLASFPRRAQHPKFSGRTQVSRLPGHVSSPYQPGCHVASQGGWRTEVHTRIPLPSPESRLHSFWAKAPAKAL